MGLTRVETDILWSGVAGTTLNAATVFTSDAFTFDPTTVAASIALSADNQGTPASGDTVTFYLAYTSGDLLGNTGDDYDTDEHAIPIGVIDTYPTNTPGEDPGRRTITIPTTVPKGAKLLAVAPNAATRNIIIRARLTERRAA